MLNNTLHCMSNLHHIHSFMPSFIRSFIQKGRWANQYHLTNSLSWHIKISVTGTFTVCGHAVVSVVPFVIDLTNEDGIVVLHPFQAPAPIQIQPHAIHEWWQHCGITLIVVYYIQSSVLRCDVACLMYSMYGPLKFNVRLSWLKLENEIKHVVSCCTATVPNSCYIWALIWLYRWWIPFQWNVSIQHTSIGVDYEVLQSSCTAAIYM